MSTDTLLPQFSNLSLCTFRDAQSLGNSAHSDTGVPSPSNSDGCKIEPPDSPDPLDLELNGQTKLDEPSSLTHPQQHPGHNTHHPHHPHHQHQQQPGGGQGQPMYPGEMGGAGAGGGKPPSSGGIPNVSSSSMGLGSLGSGNPAIGATAPHHHPHQPHTGMPSSLTGVHTQQHPHQTNDVSALMPDYQAL